MKKEHECKKFIGTGAGDDICIECGKYRIYDVKKFLSKLEIIEGANSLKNRIAKLGEDALIVKTGICRGSIGIR